MPRNSLEKRAVRSPDGRYGQTRSSGVLDIPLCRLSTGQRSFSVRGAKLWNSLNDNIKSLKCPRNFRRHLVNVLLS